MMKTNNEPKIIFSSANFGLDPAAFLPLSFLGRFVDMAGYDAVEMHPILHSPAAIGSAVLLGQVKLESVHQSFRVVGAEADTNKPLNERSKADKLFSSFAGSLIMPTLEKSYEGIQKIQKIIGQRIPGVFYPQSDPARDKRYLDKANTSVKLFQPTDYVARHFGVRTVEDMVAVSHERGYDGFCLDTFHVQRYYGNCRPGVISNLNQTLDVLAKGTKAVHVSLNRYDFEKSEPHIDSRGDAKQLLEGKVEGILKDMLDAVLEQGQTQTYTVELTLKGIRDATGLKKLKDLNKAYEAIGGTLREYVASAD